MWTFQSTNTYTISAGTSSDRRINIPNHPPEKMKQIVLVLFGTLRHTEQHTKSWTKTEHGKVKISDVKNMAANEQNLSNDGLVLLYFTVSNNGYAMTVVYDVKESS